MLHAVEWFLRYARAFARVLGFLIVLALLPVGFVLLVEISEGEALAWALVNPRKLLTIPSALREAFLLHVVAATREDFREPMSQTGLIFLHLA